VSKNKYKDIISFLIAICVSFALSAQRLEPGPIITREEPFFTEAKFSRKEMIPVTQFGTIIVKDARVDKTIGYVQPEAKKDPQCIAFKGNAETYLNKLFNNSIIVSSNTDTILIVLHDLWMNETRTEAADLHKLFLGMEKLVSSCHVVADIFGKRNGAYSYVSSIDSVLSKKSEWLAGNADKLVERTVKLLIKTADTSLKMKTDWMLISNQQIDSIAQIKIKYPIVVSDKPQKGIYLSFEEFLNDKPRQIPFDVISSLSNDIDYPGKIREHPVWGYSDGEKIYMHIGKGYYQLNKRGSTFDVTAPAVVEYINSFLMKSIQVITSYYTSSDHIIDVFPYFQPGKYTIYYYKYYRLDLRNGKLY
jgi:hypothetical protein